MLFLGGCNSSVKKKLHNLFYAQHVYVGFFICSKHVLDTLNPCLQQIKVKIVMNGLRAILNDDV